MEPWAWRKVEFGSAVKAARVGPQVLDQTKLGRAVGKRPGQEEIRGPGLTQVNARELYSIR